MSEQRTSLGIDLGTSSVKAMLIDATGAVVSQANADYPVDRPHPGWAETDPQAWWAAVQAAVKRVLGADRVARLAGIGLSGQMHGVVLCRSDGSAIRPALLWADARAEDELTRYRALPSDVLPRLANPLSPGMAGQGFEDLRSFNCLGVLHNAVVAWNMLPRWWAG